MGRVLIWYNKLSRRARLSTRFTIAAIGFVSTVMSITGGTLYDWTGSYWRSFVLVVLAFICVFAVTYWVVGIIYRDSVSMSIRGTSVTVRRGDIFEAAGLRVIGFDTRFDTRVDDVVIAKGSLHGKLVIEHGESDGIRNAVAREARRLGIPVSEDGLYRFPLGSMVRYESPVDGATYLLLAMTELDEDFESHSNMAKYEHMLMKMWEEIGRLHAYRSVALPLLGAGITRFDDGPKDRGSLLRCMLCTLNGSGVALSSSVEILIYGDGRDIPLYEYKDVLGSL